MTPGSVPEVRLLLVTNDYPPRPGGIQQYLGNLVAAYPDPVLVLAPHDGRAGVEPGVVRHRGHFLWPTRQVGAWIEAAAARFAPDAVLFGAPHPLPLVGPRLRRHLGIPFGVLAHGAEVTVPAAFPGTRTLVAHALRSADVRFAVSRFTARAVERLTGLPVIVVGAGVDVASFHPPAETRRRDVPVVGCVSRFVPRKGQDRLLHALARLDRPAEALLVGRGRTETSLRRLAARLDVPVRFRVDVPWERLPELYREMDVFCMPCRSRWMGLEAEGLGLVYLEAAATGLPVLAGDSGGAPETVLPGVTGYVVHSVNDIVAGLRLLLGDPDRAREQGAAGRRRVEREFTWGRVADRLRAGFEAVVDPPAGGGSGR